MISGEFERDRRMSEDVASPPMKRWRCTNDIGGYGKDIMAADESDKLHQVGTILNEVLGEYLKAKDRRIRMGAAYACREWRRALETDFPPPIMVTVPDPWDGEEMTVFEKPGPEFESAVIDGGQVGLLKDRPVGEYDRRTEMMPLILRYHPDWEYASDWFGAQSAFSFPDELEDSRTMVIHFIRHMMYSEPRRILRVVDLYIDSGYEPYFDYRKICLTETVNVVLLYMSLSYDHRVEEFTRVRSIESNKMLGMIHTFVRMPKDHPFKTLNIFPMLVQYFTRAYPDIDVIGTIIKYVHREPDQDEKIERKLLKFRAELRASLPEANEAMSAVRDLFGDA
jgi:hypothetical protein